MIKVDHNDQKTEEYQLFWILIGHTSLILHNKNSNDKKKI